MENIQQLLPITDKDTDFWTHLKGCNNDRWHAPGLQSRFTVIRKAIVEVSKWYETTIRHYYPTLNIIHLNAIQSAPGADKQNCLHLDYNIQTQDKKVSHQPMSAIIAIEQFCLDIVTDPSNKDLKTVTVEPFDMIVFTNKCFHWRRPTVRRERCQIGGGLIWRVSWLWTMACD